MRFVDGSTHTHTDPPLAQAFKDGDVRFLICTDVAARGIDIKGLPYCINLTLPDQDENYVHRIGRVGRAECMGLAISFVALAPEKVCLVLIRSSLLCRSGITTRRSGGQTLLS